LNSVFSDLIVGVNIVLLSLWRVSSGQTVRISGELPEIEAHEYPLPGQQAAR
jgi:hypothetical protein